MGRSSWRQAGTDAQGRRCGVRATEPSDSVRSQVAVNLPVLDLSTLRTAVALLDDALRLTADEAWFRGLSAALQNTLVAGVIQNFEFVYELSIKMLRRELERGADAPTDIDRANFRDIVRMGAERGLVEDVEAWFHYRQL